jgi:hypothetical protein
MGREAVVMSVRLLKLSIAILLAQLVLLSSGQAQKAAEEEPPPVPKGVEVMARGPVHEAFASLAGEPIETKPVPKRPPKPLDELPPAEKPEGQVIWIGGYWAWDDERKDYLWVSGIWRTPPPHKQWIAGYWHEVGEQWQWVPGFWTEDAAAEEPEAKQVTYLPKPPDPPEVAPPGQAPAADTFFVPGSWIYNPSTGAYGWRAGHWARVQPGYVWVPNHYRWTPTGYIFIPGYWDLAVSRRGVLYAPVIVDPLVVTAGYTYTPAYAVSDTVVVDALFVQPMYAHYYFGDYYGPAYGTMGFQSVYVYGGARYDSIIVYESWAHRSQPNWISLQIDIFNNRSRGVLPVPPRTLVQQNTIIQQNITNVTNVTNNTTNVTNNTTNVTNNTTNANRTTVNYNTPVLATTSKVMAAKGVKTVSLDTPTRMQAKQQAAAVQQVAMQRSTTERPLPPGSPRQARVASLSVPKAQPVKPGFVAPRVTPQALSNAQSAHSPQPAKAPASGVSAPSTTGSVSHPNGGSHPASAPGAYRPTAAHAPPGPAPRTMPGSPAARPLGHPQQPPARRPPPKDSKEHH